MAGFLKKEEGGGKMGIEKGKLLDKLFIVIKRVEIIARMSPNSIEDEIYKQYIKAYDIVKNNGKLGEINIGGWSRPYADYYGYEAPLLKDISEAEVLLDKMKRQYELENDGEK